MEEIKTSVEGAPQEEVAKKPVRKTRTPRKGKATVAANENNEEGAQAEKKPKRQQRAPRSSSRNKNNKKPVKEQVGQEVINEEPAATEVAQNTEVEVTAQVLEAEVPVEDALAPIAEDNPQVAGTNESVEVQPLTQEPIAEVAEQPVETVVAPAKAKVVEQPVEPVIAPAKAEEHEPERPKEKQEPRQEPKPKPIPPLPNVVINDIVELVSASQRSFILNDQQIQTLTLEEAERRFQYMEYTLANVLDYDIVLSDTNIWLELLVGHTSSHSDPRVNARLQFERQLEFISRLMKHRHGRFMMMAETYEEIDRFATAQEPTNYRDADWNDEALCRNVAARLAKRLILSQQRENRLRIEGIGAESHHSAFADPAIIRRTVELFANGYKVLLLTNDASVAIRSMGMCDDLQRHNDIDDETWDALYAPLRPMVITMDDLKVLDNYTRQYHYLQMAAGAQWMQDIPQRMNRHYVEPLDIWLDGFRPGDRYEKPAPSQSSNKEQQRQKEKEKEQQRQKDREAAKLKEQQRQQERQRQKEEQRKKEELRKQEEVRRQDEQRKQEETRRQEEQRHAEVNPQKEETPKQEPVAQQESVEQAAPQQDAQPQTPAQASESQQQSTAQKPKPRRPARRPSRPKKQSKPNPAPEA